MRILLHPINAKPRECGTCTLCCRVMGVPEFKKEPDIWCEHARSKRGCGIYETRPQSCRDFQCVWLAASDPPPLALRPDKIHGVLTSTKDGQHLVLHEDVGYPGVAHTALRGMLNQWIADGRHYYIVKRGTRRTFFGNTALYDTAMAMMSEKMGDDVQNVPA